MLDSNRKPASSRISKTCGCSGVRWCAGCLDLEVRRAHKMDPPLALPPPLETRPAPGTDSIFEFDPVVQSAPGCPAFGGLRVIPDFLSAPEARALLEEIEKHPFAPAQSGKLKQHFGARFNFNKQKLNASRFRGLPGYVQALESRLVAAFRETCDVSDEDGADKRRALSDYRTTDLFVLRYQERDASNLDLHTDDRFAYGEAIFDVSLEGNSVLTFVRGANAQSERRSADRPAPIECVRVVLRAGSAALLFGRARYEWEHAILHYDVVGQRTSMTLRTLSEPLRRTEDGRHVLEVARAVIPDEIFGAGTANGEGRR